MVPILLVPYCPVLVKGGSGAPEAGSQVAEGKLRLLVLPVTCDRVQCMQVSRVKSVFGGKPQGLVPLNSIFCSYIFNRKHMLFELCSKKSAVLDTHVLTHIDCISNGCVSVIFAQEVKHVSKELSISLL